jgi:DNA mismatch repair protein MSH5
MAPFKRNAPQRGRPGSHRPESARTRERPSTASSHRTSVRRFKRPASEWHSDGSERQVSFLSRHSSHRPENNPMFLTPVRRPSRPRSSVSINIPEEVDESSDHIIMALDIKDRGSIGCAYYVARDERLFCMEDVPKGGIDVVEKCESIPMHGALADKNSEDGSATYCGDCLGSTRWLPKQY